MPTPAERQALLFVAAVAALGVGVRGCRALEPAASATDRTALAVQMAAVDSAVASGGARRPTASRRGRPPTPAAAPKVALRDPVSRDGRVDGRVGGRVDLSVDVDVASAAELDRLPGIGPALAGRIVADRDAHGPFGSLQALERVKGIGPALAAKIAPLVTFSSSPRPSDTELRPLER